MLKTALAAALIVGAASSTALAKNGAATQYYFDTAGGGAYCDGLLLTAKGKTYTGTHNSPTGSCSEGNAAFGFSAKGFSSGAMGSYETVTAKTVLATITTEDEPNGGSNFEIIFNLDIKNKIWSVFVTADGTSPVNGGPLGVGGADKPHAFLNRPAFQK
jgi:hypothetical protein